MKRRGPTIRTSRRSRGEKQGHLDGPAGGVYGGELLPVLHADALVDADLGGGTEGDDQLGGSLQHQDLFCSNVFLNNGNVLHHHQVKINKQ